ncbi:hypothetical protein RND81_03G070800 [Saponaria officinalis]|uniref:Small ribosomal subunit protein uS10 domain-containing protein n=1 Tax=Saponaria officinalis TaxID=3572 RepID=A0AAW1M6B9_SAPOF
MEIQKTRVSLASTSLETTEKACADIISRAKDLGLVVWGPFSLKSYNVNVKAPLLPSRKGTELYGSFEMRVHQRLLDILVYPDFVKEKIIPTDISNLSIEVTVINVSRNIAQRDCIRSGKVWSEDWEMPAVYGCKEEK